VIDEKAIREAYAKLAARVEALERLSGMFVSDKDLDDPRFGDPVVKFDVRSWRGPSYVGKKFSQCSPDFLEALAESLQYSAEHPKEGKEKYAAFNRKDAARARTHARRIRSGVVPPPPEARALAGETEWPDGPAPQAPSFEAPAFEAPSFGEYSDADEDVPTF
jgi:hypothetical protein